MNRILGNSLLAILLLIGQLRGDEPLPTPNGLLPTPEPSGQIWASGNYHEYPPLDAEQTELLRQQLLDLEPDRANRRVIEQVRLMEEANRPIDVSDQDWIEIDDQKLLWGGRAQGDWVMWANDRDFGGQPNYFEFRRLRLFAAGHGYGVWNYQLELEFGNDTSANDNGVEIKDVYLEAEHVPILGRVRLGFFRVPLGLEQMTSGSDVTFLERGLPTALLPNRELGIGAYDHTELLDATLSAGMYFHDLSDTAHAIEDDSHGFRLATRFTHLPYYDEPSGGRYLFHYGISYSFLQPRRRRNDAMPAVPFYPIDFDSRPEINRGDDLVMTGDLNARHSHVINAESALVWGPFSMQAEATFLRVDERELGTIDLFGAYVNTSWFLTGEHRNFDRREAAFDTIKPFENFWVVDTCDGPQAGRGAWEMAARWSYLDFSDIIGQQLNDLTIGLNWYWNPRTRMTFNWIHPFAHRSPVGREINAAGDIIGMRLEVKF